MNKPNECDHSVFEPNGCPIFSFTPPFGSNEIVHCQFKDNPKDCPCFKEKEE